MVRMRLKTYLSHPFHIISFPFPTPVSNLQLLLSSLHPLSKNSANYFQTVAAVLKILCKDVLVELEKPLEESLEDSSEQETQDLRCRVIIREYHAFLGSRFLHAVQERQMVWNWGRESAVFEGVGWLQKLWASRKGVC